MVLCCSRMLFFQCYLVFTRFYCKVFLTDALEYVTGAAAIWMIDNTHVVVAWAGALRPGAAFAWLNQFRRPSRALRQSADIRETFLSLVLGVR